MLQRSDLHGYQNRAINFIKSRKKCGLFIEMGLGKTVSTLTAIRDLQRDFKVNNVLVIAPLRVCMDVWRREHLKWEHISDLNVRVCTGDAKERKRMLNRDANIHVINRENVSWLKDNVNWKWDMVVIDESSSFKSIKAKRFKDLAVKLPLIDYTVLLTGTPSPQSLLDLWSQIYLLDQGERLCKTMMDFKSKFFQREGFHGYGYSAIAGAKEKVMGKVKDIVLSMEAKDYLELPPVSIINTCYDLSDFEYKKYKSVEKTKILEVASSKKITITNAASVTNKLLQFTSGFMYDEHKEIHTLNEDKLQILGDIVDDNPSENILVSYMYKADIPRLLKRFPFARILDKNPETIDEWNEGKIRMLIAHPASAGHGINLQHGGSLLVWYGLTWSVELYQQMNARLNRQGQKKPVRIIRIVCNRTRDTKLIDVLEGKITLQAALLEGFKDTDFDSGDYDFI